MRACFSGFDIRQFISKRTCISVSLSIGFITLILGFLLGKSTADRHHALKDHKRLQNSRSSLGGTDIEKIEHALLSVASAKLLSTTFNEYYSSNTSTVNNQLKNHFTNCIQSTFLNASQDNLEIFLSHLLNEEYRSFIKCSDDLKTFLQNDLQ